MNTTDNFCEKRGLLQALEIALELTFYFFRKLDAEFSLNLRTDFEDQLDRFEREASALLGLVEKEIETQKTRGDCHHP